MTEPKKRPRQPRRPQQAKRQPRSVQRRTQQEEYTHGVSSTEKHTVQFRDREALGNFCVQLTADHIPFELGGFRTIVIATTYLDHLPETSAQLYEAYRRDGQIEAVSLVAVSGRRRGRLLSEKETDRLLKNLSENY